MSVSPVRPSHSPATSGHINDRHGLTEATIGPSKPSSSTWESWKVSTSRAPNDQRVSSQTRVVVSVSPGPDTGSGTDIGARLSVSASSEIRFRSAKTGSCYAPTKPATTRPKSTVRSPRPNGKPLRSVK